MITLKTGMPRNGKTLSLVTELAAMLKRWESHPGESRPVYQFGITDLTLAVQPLPVFPLNGNKGDPIPLTPAGKPSVPLAWDDGDIPDGALILLDECQDFFPPRGPTQAAAAHVKALNTHGHRNLDFIILTQHPKNIDNSVRRLVNKHQHYRRAFGGKSAITYEWDTCSDALEFRKAIKGLFSYPRKSFGLYKSATGFVKPSFKLPAFLLVPALAVPLAVWSLPSAFSALKGSMTGTGIGSSAAPAAGAAASAGQLPARARPAAPVQALPRRNWAAIAGCMSVGADCHCRDHRGLRVPTDSELCRMSASGFDGLVKWEPRQMPDPAPDAQPAPAPTVAHAQAL